MRGDWPVGLAVARDVPVVSVSGYGLCVSGVGMLIGAESRFSRLSDDGRSGIICFVSLSCFPTNLHQLTLLVRPLASSAIAIPVNVVDL